MEAGRPTKAERQADRAARELWKLCAVSGSQVHFVARTIEMLHAEGDDPDWWERGAPRRRR